MPLIVVEAIVVRAAAGCDRRLVEANVPSQRVLGVKPINSIVQNDQMIGVVH